MLVKIFKTKNKLITIIVLAALIFNSLGQILLYPKPVMAAMDSAGPSVTTQSFPLAVMVEDMGAQMQRTMKDMGDKWSKGWTKALSVAVKQALGYFLNTLAYDLATGLASGDKGQKPFWEKEGWGPYMQNLADNAAGSFIEGLTQAQGFPNLCNPSFNLKLGITLGLRKTTKPAKPSCSLSDISKNWEKFATDPNFLNRLSFSFDPWGNETGIAMSTYSNFFSSVVATTETQAKNREEAKGMKPKTDTAGNILTPATMIDQASNKMVNGMGMKETSLIGEPLADAISTFGNTLAGKLIERLMEKGFSSGGKSSQKYDWSKVDSLISKNASPVSSGREDARLAYANFFTNSYKISDPSLSRLDVPTYLLQEGIISNLFKTAIDNKMTVAEAVKNGMLQADGAGSTFGYSSSKQQPGSREGYAYSSMVILRKFRILPVGWELAASYIGQNSQEKIYSLGDMIRAYDQPDSPFYRLVDPNWVLKSPETYCRIEGPGDQLIMDDWKLEKIYDSTAGAFDITNPPQPYEYNRHVVGRKDYCADYQSCIFENDQGNCVYYGYCTEEKPIWRFDGTACPSLYNSCQAYSDKAGNQYNFLENTINTNDCNSGNIGCGWFCADYNAMSNRWTCVADGKRVLKKCEALGICSVTGSIACAQNTDCPTGEICQNAGCPVTDTNTGRSCTIKTGEVSCEIPSCNQSSSLVKNSSLEIPAGNPLLEFAAGWTTADDTPNEVARTSGKNQQVNAGSYSLRLYYPGGTKTSISARTADIDITQAGTYTLSAQLYNNLIYGQPVVEVSAGAALLCSSGGSGVKNTWTVAACEFTLDAAATVTVQVKIDNNGQAPVGTVWFDNFNLMPSCPTEDIVLTLVGTIDRDNSKIFLDRDAPECEAENSGCRELISTQEGLGTNLLVNGSFEMWSNLVVPDEWALSNMTATKLSESAPESTTYLELGSTVAGATFNSNEILGIRPGKIYIISAFVKSAGAAATNWQVRLLSKGVCSGTDTPCAEDANCAGVTCDDVNQALNVNNNPVLPETENWQRVTFDPIMARAEGSRFRISFRKTDNVVPALHLDGVQVEGVALADQVKTDYKEYGSINKVFLKTPPDFLDCTGFPEKDNALCQQYATKCQFNEVGCGRYTPTNGDPPVPAITQETDFCPKECNGYQAFKESATFFTHEQFPIFFIADTGVQCEAENRGCDEFTNLDEVARGGEGRQYYTYIRQCQKPNTQCRPFYTWVGSETTGYQLQVYSLRYKEDASTDIDGDGTNEQIPAEVPNPRTDLGNCRYNGKPAPVGADTCTFDSAGAALGPVFPAAGWVEMWDGTGCYNPADAAKNALTNPYCKEFVTEIPGSGIGKKVYNILLNTISCTDDCHPFRLINTTDTDCEDSGGVWGECQNAGSPLNDAACTAAGGFKLVGSNICYITQANCGGNTYIPRNECIYQANPAEAITCPVAQAGCREYKGNASSNVRTILYDDFEDSDTRGWSNGTISTVSVVGGGHSIKTQGNFVISFYGDNGGAACDSTLPDCSTPAPAPCYNPATETCTFNSPVAGITETCQAKLGDEACGVMYSNLTPNNTYIISFWAKSGSGLSQNINIDLVGADPGSDYTLAANLKITADWQQYVIGPVYINSISPDERLDFFTAGEANLDYITIKKVEEYNYVIKNSWKTPASCDTNPFLDLTRFPAPNAPQFMAGCQEYYNTEGNTVYLKSFENICRDAAVGCQAYIDTKNSGSPMAQTFNESSQAARVDVPADSMSYFVYDSAKQCSAEKKGCQNLGRPTLDSDTGAATKYDNVYFINNPDNYNTSLCTEKEVGCKEFVSESEGITYFRDPQKRGCEYKAVASSDQYGWFKLGTTSKVPDCPLATYSLGVVQPGKSCLGGTRAGALCQTDVECLNGWCMGWSGICPTEFSSCKAFVDPLSTLQKNLIPNGNFEGFFKSCSETGAICQVDPDCTTGACNQVSPLHWLLTGGPVLANNGGLNNSASIASINPGDLIYQAVKLDEGTLYTVTAYKKVSDVAQSARLIVATDYTGGSDQGIFRNFDNSVMIVNDGRQVILSMVNTEPDEFERFTGRFFVVGNDSRVRYALEGIGTFDNIELKKTGIYNYLDKDLDKTSCNGISDQASGCVLFNDISNPFLEFDSLHSEAGQPPKSCSGSYCDSNLLLKVRPDRDCASWLDCVTGRIQVNYQTGLKDTYCQQISTCDSLNTINGRCNNYPKVEQKELEFPSADVDLLKNYSGFSKVGMIWDNNTFVQGYFPYSEMRQKKVCVKPEASFNRECLEDADCQTSPEINNGDCQPVLQVRKDKDIYESCRVYPENSSPRWGNIGPADTGDKPAKSQAPLVDIINPLAGGRSSASLLETTECAYLKERNKYQGTFGFCAEKDPRSDYLCLNWLPVDELTGGWIGITGWNDNVRDQQYYCTEGALLETRYPTEYQNNECYKTINWAVVGGFIGGLGGLIGAGIGFGIGSGAMEINRIINGESVVSPLSDTNDAIKGVTYYLGAESKKCGSVLCPIGYIPRISSSDCSDFFHIGLRCRWFCAPDQSDLFENDTRIAIKWYDYHDRVTLTDLRQTKRHIMYNSEKPGGITMWDPEKDTTPEGDPLEWRRVCTRLAKVSQNDGSSKAWMERMEATPDFRGTDYIMEMPKPYDFVLATINQPFGGLNPKYKGDPTAWPIIEDRLNPKILSEPMYPTYLSGNAIQETNVGQFYYDKYYGVDSGGGIPRDVLPIAGWGQGLERIKRIFAQSYGGFEWNGSSYQKIDDQSFYCKGGFKAGQSCPSDDAAGDNTCTDTASNCVASPGFCSYRIVPPLPDAVRWYDSTNVSCNDAPGVASAACQNMLRCVRGTCSSDNGVDDDTDAPCDTLKGIGCQKSDETCHQPGYGLCSGVYKAGFENESCIGDAECHDYVGPLSTCQKTPNSGYCAAGPRSTLACDNDGWCQAGGAGAYCIGRCSGGLRNNGLCRNVNATTGASLGSAECRFSGTCEPMGAWTPPPVMCPKNSRPTYFTEIFTGHCSVTIAQRCWTNQPNNCPAPETCIPDPDALSPGDWCGVSPIVDNFLIESAPASAFDVCDGGGNVNISFTVDVDSNQLPLKKLEIDWGDGLTTSPDLGGGIYDKADPKDPFRFFHAYKFDGNRGADPNFNQIRIRIRDNWNWCSNSVFGSEGGCPVEGWVVPGNAKVNVYSTACPS